MMSKTTYENLVEELNQPDGLVQDNRNLEIFLKIHRCSNCYIEFFKKVGMYEKGAKIKKSYYKHVCTLKASSLKDEYAKIAPHLNNDGYFTLNSFSRPIVRELGKTLYSVDEWHIIGQTAFLNACIADLDVGRQQSHDWTKRQDWIEALQKVFFMMTENHLPKASIIAKSGRGINILWLLQDEEYTNTPIVASPEKVNLYRKVNGAIIKHLKCLAADEKANTESKLLRVPESINTRVDKKAKYAVLKGINGNCPLYNLSELAIFFNI